MTPTASQPEELPELSPEPGDVPYDTALVADAFLERVSDAVNLTPETEEAIRSAVAAATTPEAALTAAHEVCLAAIGSITGEAGDALRDRELQAVALAVDEIRSAWRRQGDSPEGSAD